MLQQSRARRSAELRKPFVNPPHRHCRQGVQRWSRCNQAKYAGWGKVYRSADPMRRQASINPATTSSRDGEMDRGDVKLWPIVCKKAPLVGICKGSHITGKIIPRDVKLYTFPQRNCCSIVTTAIENCRVSLHRNRAGAQTRGAGVILIVDDMEDGAVALCKLLTREGYPCSQCQRRARGAATAIRAHLCRSSRCWLSWTK